LSTIDMPAPGKIVTFYSYKGGTGRTMALANTAWILALAGKKVLAVDWDLESPGLHKFFHPFLDSETVATTSGIIELISNYSWAATTSGQHGRDWHREYARILPHAVSLKWDFPGDGGLDFVSAGRQNRDYSSLVSSMNWDNFYERLGGGQFFDALRADMKQNYDYVLIDSRTGLSDIAEICTVHMPDILMTCFTLSAQSIEGAAAVARHIDERYPGRGIRILPVPMRIENAELEKVDASRAVARAQFDRFPKDMTRDEASLYWLAVEIPYRPFYAFEETLAIFGDASGSPGSLLSAFERLTAAITAQEVLAFQPIEDELRKQTLRRFARLRPAGISEIVLSYVSDDRPWADWISATLDRSGFRVVTHCADSDPEERLGEQIQAAGRTMALLSPAYIQAHQTKQVWGMLVAAAPIFPPTPQRLVALRVLDAKLSAPFAAVSPVDLSGLDEQQATDTLLAALDHQTRPVEHPAGLTPAGPRFPGQGANPAIWNVGTRNARFTGRSSVLEELRTQLLGGSQAIVLPQALHGLGGVGKTQVALEYAHRFKADYDLVWWISAEQPDLIRTALAELAGRLGFQVRESVADAAESARDALRRGNPSPRWLLIFDNAGDPKEIEGYIPGGDGHVVITSRNQAWSRVAAPLEVDVFTSVESVDYLVRRVRGLTPEEALEIGIELGFLPLAIEQAAAWLEVTGVPAHRYLEMLTTQTADVLDLDAPADYPVPVARTWNLSFQQLQQASPAAARMLELFAFFAPDPISLDMIYSDEMARLLARFDDTLREKLVLGKVVREVNRFALARVDQGNNALQVHRLVQAVIRSRMTPEQQEMACRDVHSILKGALPKSGPDDPTNWPKFDQILPHIIPSRALSSGDEEVRQMLIDMVRYLWKRNDFERGLSLGNQLADLWEEQLDSDHWQRLFLQSQLANHLRSMGRYQEALELDEVVLTRQRASASIGVNHPHTWITAGGLAGDLRALGRFDEALAMDQETHERLKDLFGEDHPRTLLAAANLAVSLRLVGDCFTALDLDRETLATMTAVFGPEHPSTLLTASALGQDLRETGNFEQSVATLRTTARRYGELLGEKTLEALRITKSLAVSLRRAGYRDEAFELVTQTCEWYDQLFRDTPDAVAASLELASCMSAVGEKYEARDRALSILESQRQALGPDHPYTLAAATNLSSYMRGLGDLETARSLGEATLNDLVGALGEDHPYVLCCAVNVANTLGDLGHFVDAERLERANLRLLTEKLGPTHPDTLACQSNLAITLQAQGRAEEAAKLRKSTTDALKRTLGDGHPSVRSAQEGVRLNRDLEPQPI
jgi:MinD-like ATPase involved in chromosome partitioning or flagellar assembly/tetratricopeptide (TPR) repeat protein